MKEQKKKLNLDDLEVQSFVTTFTDINDQTDQIMGGNNTTPIASIVAGDTMCEPSGGGTDSPTCPCVHTEYTPSGCYTEICSCD